MSGKSESDERQKINVKISNENLLENEVKSIKTIYSEESEEILNNIQNMDILEKIKNKRRLYVHDLCELARSKGRFEHLTLGLAILMIFFLGFYGSLNVLTYRPVRFQCRKFVEGIYQWVQCEEAEACMNVNKNRYRVIHSDFFSVTEKFELYCDKKDLLYLMTNVIMFFSPLSCFIFGYMADFVGRRKALFLLIPIGLVGFLLSYFGNEFTLFLVGNCCLCSFLQSMVMLLYLYVNEILGRKLRSVSVALLGLSYALGEIVFLGFYDFMTSYKQVYLAQGICIIICIPIIRFLRESPFYLANTKQFRKLSKMLKKIMETNFKNNTVGMTRWRPRSGQKK